jgi:RNA polymerase sigma-70 factor, ECF subfamily
MPDGDCFAIAMASNLAGAGSVGPWSLPEGQLAEDTELVARMLAGDQRAFNRFFDTYAERIAGFARRRCALDPSAMEDVVQLTMINAMRNLSSFRGESSLFTWLCTICRNQLADHQRRVTRRPATNSLEEVIAARSTNLPIQLVDYRDPLDECTAESSRNEIRHAINTLPPRYARILELRYGDELSMAQITFAMGLTDTAAQSLLARARRAFREVWSASGVHGAGSTEGTP